MNVIAIVQARMGSTRLNGKVMMPILNKIPAIELLLKRLSKSKKIEKIVIATSKNRENNKLDNYLKKIGFDVYRGDEKNVLSRFNDIVKKYKPNIVVRITGDCPLVDPILIDKYIELFLIKNVDYLSNTLPHTYPNGFDVEVFTSDSIKKSYLKDKSKINTEHVTHFIKNSSIFTKFNVELKNNLFHFRVTLDNKNDLRDIKKIFNYFYPDIYMSHKKIIKILPEIFPQKILENFSSTGNQLWIKAKKIIPGGNMLLSKNPETFLPGKWPTYFSKANKCYIWDLDNKKFIDFSYMGIGTNILGYCNKEVDNAVISAIKTSNMSTLNCPQEVLLAEKLISMHKWAGMVKFARTGGEANAIAIRIARAAAKKDCVAVCGYHGWHDWYLSANLNNSKSLDGLLLKGLNIEGVPKNLKNTTYTFNYNNIGQLKELIETKNIGIIKMEVMRNQEPKNNFLQEVRKIATKNNIILIFDECTSGFRESFGGLHLKYNVIPDIAILGKAIGNGYAITSVIGKKDIMLNANKTFISSTFWTEKIGNVAALKTLEIMEKNKTWKTITQIGLKVKKEIKKIGEYHKLNLSFSGLPSLLTFNIHSVHNRNYKMFITNEMLKKGILATNSIYFSIEHNQKIIDFYLDSLNKTFELIKNLEESDHIPKSKSHLFTNLINNKFDRLN